MLNAEFCFGSRPYSTLIQDGVLLQMSTTTPKVVMFNMEIGDAPPEESADAVDHNQLEEQVKELGQAIAGKWVMRRRKTN